MFSEESKSSTYWVEELWVTVLSAPNSARIELKSFWVTILSVTQHSLMMLWFLVSRRNEPLRTSDAGPWPHRDHPQLWTKTGQRAGATMKTILSLSLSIYLSDFLTLMLPAQFASALRLPSLILAWASCFPSLILAWSWRMSWACCFPSLILAILDVLSVALPLIDLCLSLTLAILDVSLLLRPDGQKRALSAAVHHGLWSVSAHGHDRVQGRVDPCLLSLLLLLRHEVAFEEKIRLHCVQRLRELLVFDHGACVHQSPVMSVGILECAATYMSFFTRVLRSTYPLYTDDANAPVEAGNKRQGLGCC